MTKIKTKIYNRQKNENKSFKTSKTTLKMKLSKLFSKQTFVVLKTFHLYYFILKTKNINRNQTNFNIKHNLNNNKRGIGLDQINESEYAEKFIT